MKKIKLIAKENEQDFTTVDNEDFEYLSQFRWRNIFGYAVKSKTKSMPGIRMHRILVKCPNGKVVDHINGDRLDNRKSNLRIGTQSQNSMNKQAPKNNTSGYKGVTKKVIRGKVVYDSQIQIEGKRFYIGRYSSAEVAGASYNKIAKEVYGEFAYLNNVSEEAKKLIYKKSISNSDKTHCKNGHKFNKENTYKTKYGRNCRKCHALWERDRRKRIKHAR